MQPTGCWLTSRFSRSVETRRRYYGWLRIVFPDARLFRVPIRFPSGSGGTREAGSTVAESLEALYWVGTHQIRRGQLDRRRPRGMLNPCARELKPRTRRFLREKLISDHGLLLPTRVNKERRTGNIRRAFSGMHRALDGRMLARAPNSPAQGLHHHGPGYFNFPCFCMIRGLEEFGLVDPN